MAGSFTSADLRSAYVTFSGLVNAADDPGLIMRTTAKDKDGYFFSFDANTWILDDSEGGEADGDSSSGQGGDGADGRDDRPSRARDKKQRPPAVAGDKAEDATGDAGTTQESSSPPNFILKEEEKLQAAAETAAAAARAFGAGVTSAAGRPLPARIRGGDWTGRGFGGPGALSAGASQAPPLDASAAMGTGKVVSVANSVVSVHDATTGWVEKSARLSALFAPVTADFGAHNTQRTPSVIYDRGDNRFVVAAVSYDSSYRDPAVPGRLLIGTTSDYNPMMTWRVVSAPAPPCEAGLYSQPDAVQVSHSRYGLYLTMVLRCFEPGTRQMRYSVPRIMALDKGPLYSPTPIDIPLVPYWSPPASRISHLAPARPQHARDAWYGGRRDAAVFVAQRVGADRAAQVSVLGVFALVNASSLVGMTAVTAAAGDRPALCETAVERGQVADVCEDPAAAVLLQQPGTGPPLTAGVPEVTYGAALTYSASSNNWTVSLVAHHTTKGFDGTCRIGVYWGRLALPAAGEWLGRVSLAASDYLWSEEAGMAYPSVAATPGGTVWVGYSYSGAVQSPGVGFSRIVAGTDAFEPFINMAKPGAGVVATTKPGAVQWGSSTSADVWDEAVFFCVPYSTGASDTRNWGTWITKVDSTTMGTL